MKAKGAFDIYTVLQKMADASRLCRFHPAQ
jgi:hypothetical protein